MLVVDALAMARESSRGTAVGTGYLTHGLPQAFNGHVPLAERLLRRRNKCRFAVVVTSAWPHCPKRSVWSAEIRGAVALSIGAGFCPVLEFKRCARMTTLAACQFGPRVYL